MRGVIALVLVGALSACAPSSGAELPPDIAAGRDVYGRMCSACHGGNGQGATAPGLTSVLETFPSCDDQIRWIGLGSAQWQEEVGPTYGAPGREITAVMPSFATELTATEIAQVAAFERVRFGEGDEQEVLGDCLGR